MAGGGAAPRMSRATTAAWSPALVQCSCRRGGAVHRVVPRARRRRPPRPPPSRTPGRWVAAQPGAGVVGRRAIRRRASPAGASRRCRPPPRPPPPASRRPAAPPPGRRPRRSRPARTPTRRSTPASAYSRAASAPTAGPSAAAAGTGSASSTVTAIPRARAALATSAPMNPAPTMSSDPIRSSVARNASESSTVRSVCTCAGWSGSRRATSPVATTTASPYSVDPSDSSTSPGRRATAANPRCARTPSSSSWSRVRRMARPGSHSPVRTCLDSGGRS